DERKMGIGTSSLLVWLILKLVLGSDLPAIVESMGSRHGCEQYPSEIHWISEKTSALVIGKSEDSVQVCRLKFGLATKKEGARLRLSFDFIYNQACGVFLQINESVTSDFTNSDTNREMMMSGCNTRDPGPLFAQPKNFVLISLVKSSYVLEAYNFRLNISMAEHLPARGPQLHVVIIVGFVLFTVVILVAILLFKYITRLSYHWHDRRVEEAATRPISIYTSQEHLQRPNHTYTLRPAGGQQPIKNPPGARFCLLNGDKREFPNRNPQSFIKPEARVNSLELQNHHASGRQVPATSSQQAMDLESLLTPGTGVEFTDTASLGGCDIPPSYEEALRMPLAADVDKDMDDDGLDVAMGGRLELDGFNVEPGGDMQSARKKSEDKGSKNSEQDTNIGTS
ncbi:unnamed protein product, partial [Candidula unifasciata]